MDQFEKDKLWVDYMVTRLSWKILYNSSCSIVGIEAFSKSVLDPIGEMQTSGLDNFESWNWKWNNRVFKKK